MEKEEISYLIPAHISARFEFVPGFGWRELLYCGIAVGAALAVVMVVGMVVEFGAIIKLFSVVIPSFATFAFVRRNPLTGFSILQMMKNVREFSKNQRRFLFRYEGR